MHQFVLNSQLVKLTFQTVANGVSASAHIKYHNQSPIKFIAPINKSVTWGTDSNLFFNRLQDYSFHFKIS